MISSWKTGWKTNDVESLWCWDVLGIQKTYGFSTVRNDGAGSWDFFRAEWRERLAMAGHSRSEITVMTSAAHSNDMDLYSY